MTDAHNSVEQAWQRHAAELRNYLRRQTEDAALAEDLVQEAFLRLLKVEWPGNVRAWLFQVGRNLLIDHRRTQRPHGPLTDDLGNETAPANEQARGELGDCLPALLTRLPEPYREALELADLNELPQLAIASRQSLSLSGVKSRVQRARRLLRKAMHACCTFQRDHQGRVMEFVPKEANSCVLSAPASSSSAEHNQKENSAMKQVTIEWRHLDIDGETCTRCGNTGIELSDTVDELNDECAPRGVTFTLRDTPLAAGDLDQSNSILIDGRPIEELLPNTRVGSSDCPSCGDLVGDSASCRTLIHDDARFETVPAMLIREAVCHAVDCCTPSCGCH